MSDTSSPSLTRLLSLSSSLHHARGSQSLTLRQLVPVHESLCQAVLEDSLPTAYLEQSLDQLLSQHDVSLARAILFQSVSNCKEDEKEKSQLLVLQHLLHFVRRDALQGLANVALPFLLSSSPSQDVSDELREALLDAVFCNPMLTDSPWLQVCLDVCNKRGDDQGSIGCWTTTCRVLVRLSHACGTNRSVRKSCHDKVMQGIHKATSTSTSQEDNMTYIRPITTWLLPLLYEEDSRDDVSDKTATDELWSCLISLAPRPSTHMVVSAVLCHVLPSLVSRELPTITTDGCLSPQQEQPRCPVHEQSWLWQLLFASLRQGMKEGIPKGGGGRGVAATHSSDSTMLRRRGLYLLRILVEPHEKKNSIWTKYVLCFEALEMETEPHLVDQVWDTVAELSVAATATNKTITTTDGLPLMTWEHISVMLSRLFLSDTPVLRKLGLYRFLNGHAGVRVTVDNSPTKNAVPPEQLRQGKKKQGIQAKKKGSGSSTLAPVTVVSTDFVLDVILPSFDTLGPSVGTNMQLEENGRIRSDDVTPRLSNFLSAYIIALAKPSDDDNDDRSDNVARTTTFLQGLVGRSLGRLRIKTALQVFRAIADAAREWELCLPVDSNMLETAVQSFQLLFGTNSVVVSYREGLLEAFAIILSRSFTKTCVDPKLLLRVLALYPISLPMSHGDLQSDFVSHDKTYGSLQTWLSNLGESKDWASTVGAACASAYVAGQLFPRTSEWYPNSGSSETERSMGGAISLLCTLAGGSGATSSSSSSLLWPAIHKALMTVPRGAPWLNADRSTRGLILLENGCRLGALSGMGNGDLVVDGKSQQMLRPPPNIEALLSNAVNFILEHIKALASFEGTDMVPTASGGTRSGETSRVSSMFAILISQMQTLHRGYPSSMVVSAVVNDMLQLSFEALLVDNTSSIGVVTNTALAYAALSCGAKPQLSDNPDFLSAFSSIITKCGVFLQVEFEDNMAGVTKAEEQMARSIFQYAKWGALSCILPLLVEQSLHRPADEVEQCASLLKPFLTHIFTVALESVHATPMGALLPLFDCVLVASQSWLALPETSVSRDDIIYTENIQKIIAALFAVMADSTNGRSVAYMLNEFCALVFRPRLLLEEYDQLQKNDDVYSAATPIRDAFRELIARAGTKRSHISKAVLCRISVAWLGPDIDGEQSSNVAGLGAIPYRTDILKLLVHKETKMDESSTHQDVGHSEVLSGVMELPAETNDLSVARAFVLVFFSKLPEAHAGLSPLVLEDLLHFVILGLLDDFCLLPPKPGAMLMTGSVDYCLKMRSWQALCILSRFVTSDIAEKVCSTVFRCMGQNLHGQIRYFIEVFAIQCARKHPVTFGQALVQEMRRKDLSLQHITSLMIITGNLVVGRYKEDFFRQFETNDKEVTNLDEILAGTIPWLSSTQGFSRAIAQLLVHELIPLVLSTSAKDTPSLVSSSSSDWFLRSVYNFLDGNPEMKRLRKKQVKFFERYDVDEVCTPEGLLRIPVDEGDEAHPEHMVDAIKKCLEQVYLEAHENDTPMWKQVETMLQAEQGLGGDPSTVDESSLVNFQRKIIPLDALDLSLEESRNQRLKNASGRNKQQLIVCATLVDKVPNLAGLARTAEIFAADRLVIPDASVCKMDNFKSISVGAGDWIEIEECKENNLLKWLRQQKEKGYTIVGLEQTSSSIPISELAFPQRTVLLLGKEKEGIPVEFLQAVDTCVEIPQLGIIRSLNVHVTGALAIWEYTKQMMSSS